MSGALAMVGRGVSAVSVTVASSGGGGFGYNDNSVISIQAGAYGSISPGTVKGKIIRYFFNGANFIEIGIDGILTQGFFSAVVIQFTDNSVHRYLSSAFTFGTSSSPTNHSDWTLFTTIPWTSATPSPRFVLFEG